MSFPVGNVCDKVNVRTFRTAQQPVDGIDENLDYVNVLPLVETADIVSLSYLSVVENQVNRTCVVHYVEPVPHILSASIDRERLAVTYIVDEQRNELFRELVRTIVVRAVCDNGRHAVSVVECPHEMV